MDYHALFNIDNIKKFNETNKENVSQFFIISHSIYRLKL